MIFKKILDFVDVNFLSKQKINFIYGKLYKLKNEALPFRYIHRNGDKEKGLYRFKHHYLKEYVFYNLNEVEREANRKEIRIYNLIKEHINEVARKENNSNNY